MSTKFSIRGTNDDPRGASLVVISLASAIISVPKTAEGGEAVRWERTRRYQARIHANPAPRIHMLNKKIGWLKRPRKCKTLTFSRYSCHVSTPLIPCFWSSQLSSSCFEACKKYRPSVKSWAFPVAVIIASPALPVNPDMYARRASQAAMYSDEC